MTFENKFSNHSFGIKFLWKKQPVSFDVVKQVVLSTGFSFPIAEVLCARGFCDQQIIFDFLFPHKPDHLFLPMKDADLAVQRIMLAIKNEEKILIFGDYDVDGMTATSIAMIGLLRLGAKVHYYLPHRIFDGYGLSAKIVEKAAKEGFSLIITVDNGTTCFDAANKAQELGVDLIITDHHQPKGDLPKAFAIVNPHQKDCNYPFKFFCGAGVIFKLIAAIFARAQIDIPHKIFELLMLGTVADVVPLHGENRYWVVHGLNLLRNKQMSFAFQCLAENAKKRGKDVWRSTDIGFGLAPQLNALGRLDDPKSAIKFLIGSDQDEILKIAAKLLELNDKRRLVEAEVLKTVLYDIDSKNIDVSKEKILFAANSAWPPGVIGLVAGRLTSMFGRPSFVFHLDQAGIAKGSARSIPGFNLFTELEKNSAILKTFGGHKQAAGLSLDSKNLSLLKDSLESQISEHYSMEDLHPSVLVDAELRLSDLNAKFLQDYERLEPFGNENQTPTFLIKNVEIAGEPVLIKDKHLKLKVFSERTIKPVIFFNQPEFFEKIMSSESNKIDLVAQILINDFGGRTNLELQGVDFKFIQSCDE